jgi:pyridoxamine 5'-phosphate oxidase
MASLNIAELRRSYTKGGLLENEMPAEPIGYIRLWIRQAVDSKVLEPNAMTLSTVKGDGSPDSRMVLLKGVEGNSVSFFTNYRSEKAADLEACPKASCCFWWPELERQLRLRGDVTKVSRKESAEYFAIRPRESQIGAWASDQSKPLQSRNKLIQKFREFEDKFRGSEVPVPEDWGGYKILLKEVEFWQGRPGRLHDRIRYQKKETKWDKFRLSP